MKRPLFHKTDFDRRAARSPGRLFFILPLAVFWAIVPARGQSVIIDPGPRPTGGLQRGVALEVPELNIEVQVADGASVTQIEQTFHNPLNRRVEGTYLFPLPEDVAISKFTMYINGKEYEGQLLDATEARRTYESIVAKMQDPALLEWVGSRLIKASIFPIEPNSDVKVTLSYSQLLKARNGIYSYTYPLATQKNLPKPIGRFNLVGTVTTQPGEATAISSLFSPTHKVAVRNEGKHKATFSFEGKEQRPDGNFDFYYQLSEKEFGLTMMPYRREGEDGFFLIRLSPNANLDREKIQAKDICFVLDTSGSMLGKKIAQAREALKYCLGGLNEADRFNVIPFAHQVTKFADTLQPATPANVEKAQEFVKKIEAEGGTNINDALKEALAHAPEDKGERPFYVVFMTDGQATVGVRDTEEILANVAKEISKRTRLFVFGVGSDLNTQLLDLLAEKNRGARDYVLPEQNIEETLSAFYRKIAYPVLSDLKLDFGDLKVRDLYPAALGDLFVGTELVVAGRYDGKGAQAVKLTGMRDGKAAEFVYEESFPFEDQRYDFVPRLWATRKIGYLLDQIRLQGKEDPELKKSIVELATRYGIVTPYTSFLVTEEETRLALGVRGRAGALSGGDRERALQGLGYLEGESMRNSLSALGYVEERDKDSASSAMQPKADAAAEGSPPPSSMPAARSGDAAVARSLRQKALKESDVADTKKQQLETIKLVGSRTFYLREDKWVDSTYDGKTETEKVTLFSEAYFDLVAKDKELARCFALGERVIIVVGDKVYETIPAPKDEQKEGSGGEGEKPAKEKKEG